MLHTLQIRRFTGIWDAENRNTEHVDMFAAPAGATAANVHFFPTTSRFSWPKSADSRVATRADEARLRQSAKISQAPQIANWLSVCRPWGEEWGISGRCPPGFRARDRTVVRIVHPSVWCACMSGTAALSCLAVGRAESGHFERRPDADAFDGLHVS